MSKYHTVFLSREGRVYSCGHGFGGRLGHGDESSFVVCNSTVIQFLHAVVRRSHLYDSQDFGDVP